MRILIADDELMSRRLLEKTMQRAGYEVTAAQPFDLFPQTRHLECVLTLGQKP